MQLPGSLKARSAFLAPRTLSGLSEPDKAALQPERPPSLARSLRSENRGRTAVRNGLNYRGKPERFLRRNLPFPLPLPTPTWNYLSPIKFTFSTTFQPDGNVWELRGEGRGQPGLGGRRRKEGAKEGREEGVSGCFQNSQTKGPIPFPAGASRAPPWQPQDRARLPKARRDKNPPGLEFSTHFPAQRGLMRAQNPPGCENPGNSASLEPHPTETGTGSGCGREEFLIFRENLHSSKPPKRS